MNNEKLIERYDYLIQDKNNIILFDWEDAESTNMKIVYYDRMEKGDFLIAGRGIIYAIMGRTKRKKEHIPKGSLLVHQIGWKSSRGFKVDLRRHLRLLSIPYPGIEEAWSYKSWDWQLREIKYPMYWIRGDGLKNEFMNWIDENPLSSSK